MPNDAPWNGLELGKVDSRRVNANGKWDFFWTLMPGPDVGLVMQLSEMPVSIPDLPKLKNLEIRFDPTREKPVLYLRLKDREQKALFQTLCLDVMGTCEAATDEDDALRCAIERTYRWHYLLRGGKPEVLSEEAQKGLIGELRLLRRLMDVIGPRAALTAWTGPSGAPKDFELAADCIEVKARRGASQPFVSISNEFQLADVPGRRLWLAVFPVDRVEPPLGQTLTDTIEDLTRLVSSTAVSSLVDWEQHLADVGFDRQHDYGHWSWVTGDVRFHSVAPSFPRIASPVPLGVSRVSYSLHLEACAPFHQPTAAVEAQIFGSI